MSENVLKLDRDEGGLVRTQTQSGIEVKPVYGPEDLKENNQEKDIAAPGVYPFTRGIYPKMYRDRLWLKAFLVSYDTPESTNAAFKSYIENGMNDLRLTCDLPTQNGLDPDHPLALACRILAETYKATGEYELAKAELERIPELYFTKLQVQALVLEGEDIFRPAYIQKNLAAEMLVDMFLRLANYCEWKGQMDMAEQQLAVCAKVIEALSEDIALDEEYELFRGLPETDNRISWRRTHAGGNT